jgi:hypothetical protein
MLFHLAINVHSALKTPDESVPKLDQACGSLNQAELNLLLNSEEIQAARQSIPEVLGELCRTFLNDEDLRGGVRQLRTRAEMLRQSTLMFKGLIQAENRVNTAIEENRQRIDSERTRTVEILGVFTAIFAFIFSGVQLFTRLALAEALVLQAGVALIMILFFLGLHMVIEPEARTKGLMLVTVILLAVLLALPLYSVGIHQLLRFVSR